MVSRMLGVGPGAQMTPPAPPMPAFLDVELSDKVGVLKGLELHDKWSERRQV